MTRRQSKQCRDAMAAIKRVKGELTSIFESAGIDEKGVDRVIEDVVSDLGERYASYEIGRALGLPSELPSDEIHNHSTDTEEPE